MTVSLSPLARMQFNQNGIPLAGGLLFTYAAGTATKRTTYTDSTGSTPNTNPIVLDANGQCDIWLTDTLGYKFVLSPANDTDPPTNPFWTKDHISNIPSSTPSFDSVTITGDLTVAGKINKVTITQPATAATLTLADGSTLATSGANSLTLTTTAATNVTLPTSGTLVSTTAASNGQIPIGNGTGFTAATLTQGANISITNGPGSVSIAAILNPPTLVRSARTSNTILASSDNASLVDITSGTFTQTFTAAATLGSGWFVYLHNSGTGDITLDPNLSETIDGLTSYIMYPNECRLIQCDGTGFHSIVLNSYRRRFLTGSSWIKPPGYKSHGGEVGSAGSSGNKGAAGSTQATGGPGGGVFPFSLSSSLLGATETVTIGAGGASQLSSSSTGNAGGASSFGSWVSVLGGLPAASGSSGGTAFAGAVSVFGTRLTTTGVSIAYDAGATAGPVNGIWAGGKADNSSAADSGSSIHGGGAGGGIDTSGTIRAPGTSIYAGAGGAAGDATSGSPGVFPCGGGGATRTGAQSGAGANGYVDVWGEV